jgi:hypothetical protein
MLRIVQLLQSLLLILIIITIVAQGIQFLRFAFSSRAASNGRILDYRVLAGPNDIGDLIPQLKNRLIFTVFRPATFAGKATAASTVLTFSRAQLISTP